MTSLVVDDDDGIELVESVQTKMDSLDVDAISDTEWKQFAYNMQIFDPKSLQGFAESFNPTGVKEIFSSNMVIRNLRGVAKLRKTDVKKVLLDLGSTHVNKTDKRGQTMLHYAAKEGQYSMVWMLLANRFIDVSLRDRDGNTALHLAAKRGHVLVFDTLLKALKVHVNSTNNFGETPLILAAKRGNEKIVDKLLEEPSVVVTSEDHKSTPLHVAAEYGHEAIVKKLLEKMDVNSTNYEDKQSPLHLAVKGWHIFVVDLLLEESTVNPFLKDHSGNTLLHVAANAGCEEIFENLLQILEVGVNDANNEGMTALHLAASKVHANIAIKLLKMPNVNPCPKMKDDTTPLHIAARFGRADIVQDLLAITNVDVNITDSNKRTAIHWATSQGHLNVVEVLLRVPNLAPYLGDDKDDTPLHLAARRGYKDIAKGLLKVLDLDMVNKVNKKNETPLFLATKQGFEDMVDLLLGNPKVDLSICDEHGHSPFYIAMQFRHANIVEKLITLSKAIPVHSKEKMTGLHICIWGGYENLVDILLKQSPLDANAKDVCGNFPIHYAAHYGDISILQKILNAPEVDVNSVNDYLETPLHIAIKAGQVDVVDILLQVLALNVSMRDADGHSAVYIAVKYGEEEILEKLLKVVGANVNAKGEIDVNPLVKAAKEGRIRIFDKLLEVQGVLNYKTWDIRPFLFAARNGHDTIIKSLIARGVDVNGTHSSFSGTALHEAIEYGHPKVAEVLLNDPNIDPNRRNKGLEHPLFLAARAGQKEIIEMLMARGQIDVNVLSGSETALHGAAGAGREHVVKLLLKTLGIDVHIKNKNNETALFHAARADNKTILKDIYNASKVNVGGENDIVQIQLNINDKNNEGESIIHLAAWKNLLNVIDFLLEAEYDVARSVDVKLETSPPVEYDGNLRTSRPKSEEDVFTPKSALQIAIDACHYTVIEKLTKFDSIRFTQEEDGKTVLQDIFDKKQWRAFNILRRTPEVTDYIEALYKDRQASVDAANAILVGAALIASVTFASWLQPPLGYSTYYHEQFTDSLPAPPVTYPEYATLDHHPSLQAFWVFNSLSFFSAIATVISGARSVLPVEKLFIKQEVENLQRNLLVTSILLCFSMFFVLLAFATAGVVVLPPLMKFRANIFSTIGIGGSVCFVFLFLFGRNIYKLRFIIKSSQTSKKGFFEQWVFKPWHMPNPFNRCRGSKVEGST